MNNLPSKNIYINSVIEYIFVSNLSILFGYFFKKQYLETSVKNQDNVAEDKS